MSEQSEEPALLAHFGKRGGNSNRSLLPCSCFLTSGSRRWYDVGVGSFHNYRLSGSREALTGYNCLNKPWIAENHGLRKRQLPITPDGRAEREGVQTMRGCKENGTWVLLLVLGALSAIGCSGPAGDEPAADLVIRGGQLLDMTSDEPNVRPIKGLVVSDGKIARIIAADSSEELPNATEVIEAGTNTVMPALIDSHIHFRVGVLEPALHYGITTVMDTAPCGAPCGDDPNGFIVEHAKLANAPDAGGPAMYYTGVKLDGPDGYTDLEVYRLQSLEEIPGKIDELVQLGASGIKVEEGLPPEFRRKVMEEANRHGLPVVGHSRDARESISVGMRFMEHMYPISRSVAADLEKAAKEADPADQMDFAKARELIQLMVSNDVYLNPTLLGRYGVMSPRVEEFHEEDQRLLETELFAKIPQEIIARYLNNGRPRNDMPPEERAAREKGYANVQRFVREFSEQGGHLLAGTDMGNSRIPGISLHREMQLFVDAGVPPYKALLGSTRYAAEMMRMADTIGTLEEGKQADIVVLGANPVQDIAATQDLRYVIRKGRIVRSASVSGE